MQYSYSNMSNPLQSARLPQPTNTPTTLRGWTFYVALQLGRVSNLPTVWTNTLAGIVLTGIVVSPALAAVLALAMSLAYTGGMYLNDAFDRDIDALERAERPIPAGKVAARDVFLAGFFMLSVTVLLVTSIGGRQSNGLASLAGSTALAIAIVSYNVWHKGNPLSPVLMGLCRMLVYVSCALTLTSALPALLLLGAAVTFSYLIGLTYTAKQEKFSHVSTLWPLACLVAPVIFGLVNAGSSVLTWTSTIAVCGWTLYCLQLVMRRNPGDIPKAVTGLIAGIALIDGLFITIAANTYGYSSTSTIIMVGTCWLAFALTLKLQRYISGT